MGLAAVGRALRPIAIAIRGDQALRRSEGKKGLAPCAREGSAKAMGLWRELLDLAHILAGLG